MLGVQDYGLYVQFTVTISLIMSFATLGLPYAMVRFLSSVKDRKQIQDDLFSSIGLIAAFSILISLILIAFSESLAKVLFENNRYLVIILAVIIPIDCIANALNNMFRVYQEVKKYVVYGLLKTYIEIAIITIIAFYGYGMIDIALSILVVRSIFLLIILMIVVPPLGTGIPRFSRMKDYLKFSLPTIPSNLSSWIINSSDRYIIEIFMGLTYVAYYNPAYNLGSLIQMFMTPINFVLVSLVAKYFEENKIDMLKELFKYSIKYYLLFAIPAFFGLSILSKQILTLIATPEMAENSYLVVPFSALSYLIMGFGGVSLGFACYLRKKTHIDMINWILIAAINIGLNLFLVPRMGILGAAIATLAASLIGYAFGIYFAFKYFDFEIDYKSIAKIIIASLIMSAAISNIHPDGLLTIIITIGIAVVIYIVLIIPMRLITKEEIRLITSFIKRQ
jgi:O-antigen/teichoic acid export membrane protein